MSKPRKFHELSDVQINHYYKDDPRYGGCYSRDNLPSKLAKKYYVINLAPSTKPGTHWICIYNCFPNYVCYFDSYGQLPPTEIASRLTKSGKRIWWNQKDYQPLNSLLCGYYCLFYLNGLNQGFSPNEVLSTLGDKPLKSSQILKEYFKNIYLR